MSESPLACPSCSRPLDPASARDGEIRCACGVLVGVESPELDTVDQAAAGDTLDSMPSQVPGVEAIPAGTADKFSEEFLQQYVPLGFLGRGAMGAVYLMRQVKLDRQVAVKVVREETFTSEETRRLEREARVLASLNHPNIVSLYDVGVDGRLPYMVCEYVDGETLSRRLMRKPQLSLLQTLRIAVQVLDGLRAAHKKEIIHRDLKPGNIFLSTAGKPKIGDFGLAKAQTVSSGTLAGKILGTPAYMSPEQCRGSGTTTSSDIYAMGVILFEMAAGRRPFTGPEVLDYLTQHTTDPPPPVREVRPDLPEVLEAILMRALAKDPARRFDTARAFRKEVYELYKSLSAAPEGPSQKSAPKSIPLRKPGELAAGALLANRYRVLRQLGEGGMGQVWLACDEAIDGTEVALKILPPDLWRDTEARETLKQEAKLSQKLAHPNIVRLMTLEPGDPPFLVMEYVAGPTVAAELAGRKRKSAPPFSPQEALTVIEGLAAGLDHAHAKNLVHRDLKPSNVLLEVQKDGTFFAKLADFGIAAELTNYRTRVTGAVPAGTLAYMSPEQLACQKLDGRADVYSLGATLYQMLTLRPPYVGGDIAWAIKNEPVPEPTGVPEPVAAVLYAALAKQREERPPTAGALAERLRAAIEEYAPESLDKLPPPPHFEASTSGSGGRSGTFARGRSTVTMPSASGAYARPATTAPEAWGRDPRMRTEALRALVQAARAPWCVEAVALALLAAPGLLVLWFHVGYLLEGRVSVLRAAAQGGALAVGAALVALSLWMGSELVRRALCGASVGLMGLAVGLGLRGYGELGALDLALGIVGLVLLMHRAARAYCTGLRPDDLDMRQQQRRKFALAVGSVLAFVAMTVLRLHLAVLAPGTVPAVVWKLDANALAPEVDVSGAFRVRPPSGWVQEWTATAKAPVIPQGVPAMPQGVPERAAGFVFRAGAVARIAALSARLAYRRPGEEPGDVRRAAERLGRMRRRWHFKLERAEVLMVNGVPWVECTGQYRTLRGPRAVYYVETTRAGRGYELEFYGLPAFLAANRTLFANVLSSVQLTPGGN